MKCLPLHVFYLFFCLLPAGCGLQRPVAVEVPPVVSAEQVTATLESRSNHWSMFEAKVSIRAESPKGTFRVRSLVVAELPDKLRLEAYNPFGQTVGVLILEEGRSLLWIPSEKVVYTAERAKTLVDAFLGVPLPLETIGYSLIAGVPPEQLGNWEIRRTASGWTSTARGGRMDWLYTYQFTASPLAMESIKVLENRWGYEVLYQPATVLQPTSHPEKIEFRSPQWRMEVEISRMESVTALGVSAFELTLPGGIRQVRLEEGR